jgi:hypothetical protein
MLLSFFALGLLMVVSPHPVVTVGFFISAWLLAITPPRQRERE